ncbi:MAG: histidine phosphatase family protein [Chloroflexota bacterium]|nr:histidine phosphatase family protein [Chloroflexota bacterium]MDE2945887.1 histidine phosphatase family protein [Chloroflexota bacterium]
MLKTTLYLMRHGHVKNPGNILYGRRPGFYLSDPGIKQARTAGAWLADKPIKAIYSSPMERAQQTANIVAEHHKRLSPLIDERIIEVLTPHEGRPTAELAALGWDLYTGNEPPYESPGMVLERVLDFFEHIVCARAGEAVVAVAHGDILVFPWLHAQGVEPDALMKDRLVDYALPVDYPNTASIMIFELEGSPRESLPRVSYVCPY